MAEEVSQRLKAFTALAGDQRSIPSTHMRLLTIACDSRSSGFKALFGTSQVPVHAHTQPYILSQNKTIFKKQKAG